MKLRIVLIFIILAGLFYIYSGIFFPKNPFSEDRIFSIKKGENVKDISLNLEKKGLIRDSIFFEIYISFRGLERDLKAGDYLLSSSMSASEIADRIYSGETLRQKITIIEGWKIEDIGDYLEQEGIFEKEDFFEAVGSPLANNEKYFFTDYSFLDRKIVNLEGYLFPDTYYVSKSDSLEEVIRKMLDNFDRKIDVEIREEIKKQKKTLFEIITLASLLEKEVSSLQDKKIVAGILQKRMSIGMPLQVDATITYITGKRSVKVSRQDTKIDSPYNTYKYKGLPLGPICNPGIESIHASLYPESSDYLYYLSTPEGETVYSKTLEEHNIAKEKYLNN